MLLVACGLMFFQDPLLNYFNTWSTYNTWMWNRGSWVQDIPGWQSYGEPGAHDGRTAVDERAGLLVRSSAVHDARMLGHAQSQAALAQHQHLRSDRRCALWGFFFDFVIEGLFLMPMGLFTYPGAIQSLSINAGTYYQWPRL